MEIRPSFGFGLTAKFGGVIGMDSAGLACTVSAGMADSAQHLIWAQENWDAAEELHLSESMAIRRWAVVAAYYCLLHVCHALAADRFRAHPTEHGAVIEIPKRMDPQRTQLSAFVQQAYMFSKAARYLDDPGTLAATWYSPYANSAEELVDKAMTLMRTVKPELERLGGYGRYGGQ